MSTLLKLCPFCGTEPKYVVVENQPTTTTITLAMSLDGTYELTQSKYDKSNCYMTCTKCPNVRTRVYKRLEDAVEAWNARHEPELDVTKLTLKSLRTRLTALVPDTVEKYMFVQKMIQDITDTLEAIKE